MSVSLLYLIRHPFTQPETGVPASQWRLSVDGQAQVDTLAALPIWARIVAIYTSSQFKAVALGEAIQAAWDVPLSMVPDLDEVRRDGWLERDVFLAAQQAFFAQPAIAPVEGWETAHDASARFSAAIDAILDQHAPSESVVVVAHGTVLSLYTAQLMGEVPSYARWQQIGFGAIMVVRRSDRWPVTPFFTI